MLFIICRAHARLRNPDDDYEIIIIVIIIINIIMLIAVSESLKGVKRRYDLEMIKECVWVEIPVRDNYSLLIGNHYFAPDCDVKIIENYSNSLEVNLNSHLYRVVMFGDFNEPNFDWLNQGSQTRGPPVHFMRPLH
jgi:hypothetical protein